MFIVIIRAIILYALIIFALRILGKRQIGELQPSELVTTILISNIAAIPIEDTNMPMINSIAPILLLVFLELVVSHILLRSKRARSIFTGHPIVIIKDGVLDQKEMKKLRFNLDDLLEGLRTKDIFDISDVNYAVVETNGQISVLLKKTLQPLTPDLMDIKVQEEPMPSIVIRDGKLLDKNLSECKLGKGWLEKILQQNGYRTEDVFYMSADRNGRYYIIPKDKEESV